MATIAPPKPTTTGFPKSQVVEVLTAELIDVATGEAQFRGIKMPSEDAQKLNVPVPMDSLTVVDSLCAIEPILKFELRDSTVRTGGYNSVQEALDHLLPRIERAWVRHSKGQNDGSTDKK